MARVLRIVVDAVDVLHRDGFHDINFCPTAGRHARGALPMGVKITSATLPSMGPQ